MPEKEAINIQKFLKRPEVKNVTGNVNPELLERRNYRPPVCDVFNNQYTKVKDVPEYAFDIDREAIRRLPDLVNNKVQSICGIDSPDDAFKKHYNKKRSIGIVFSGGPAPGGHNVIAGLLTQPKR